MPNIFEHQIGENNGDLLIQVELDEKREHLYIRQGDDLLQISRWQALELATELLNIRKYVRVEAKCIEQKEVS